MIGKNNWKQGDNVCCYKYLGTTLTEEWRQENESESESRRGQRR